MRITLDGIRIRTLPIQAAGLAKVTLIKSKKVKAIMTVNGFTLVKWSMIDFVKGLRFHSNTFQYRMEVSEKGKNVLK